MAKPLKHRNGEVFTGNRIVLDFRVKDFSVLYSKKYCEGFPGDKDGRDKKRGTSELAYIYFMYDPDSDLSGWDVNDRHKGSLEEAGLPLDYKFSKEMLKAIDTFKENRISVERRAANALNNVLHTNMQMGVKLQSMLSKELDKILSLKEDDSGEDQKQTEFIGKILNNAVDLNKKITNSMKEIPGIISAISESEKVARKIEQEKNEDLSGLSMMDRETLKRRNGK